MFKKMLPFVIVAVVLSVVFGVLFATQRMGLTHPPCARFMKKTDDVPVEPDKEA